MGSSLAQGWLRVGSRPIRSKLGVAVLEVDGLVLVYGGASWGWSRLGLGLVSGGFKIGFGHRCA